MHRTADTHLNVATVAKLIRSDLKQFRGTKFFVRTHRYAGGSSITIRWTDGPAASEVEQVAKPYAGKGFDGSIDMSYSIDAWWLYGRIIGTRSTGTEGSRGSVPAWGLIPPHDDAVLVGLPGCYVMCERTRSPEATRIAVRDIADYWGLEVPDVVERFAGGAYPHVTVAQDRAAWERTGRYWSQLLDCGIDA